MSLALQIPLWFSFFGLALLILRFAVVEKQLKRASLYLALLILAFVAVYAGFFSGDSLRPKGGNDDLIFALVLYGFMLLGMAAHYLFQRFSQPQKQRPPFDFGLFVAPVFTSPIVFIPLMAAMQNVDMNFHRLELPRLMVFFVAFENGFFWKEYFDNRRKLKARESENGGEG